MDADERGSQRKRPGTRRGNRAPQSSSDGRGRNFRGGNVSGRGGRGNKGSPWSRIENRASIQEGPLQRRSNLCRFLASCSPCVPIYAAPNGLPCFQLRDVWRFYDQPYGATFQLVAGLRACPASSIDVFYTPYISAIQLYTSCHAASDGKAPKKVYEYFCDKAPNAREPVMDMINEQADGEPLLSQGLSSDLDPCSWYAITWYPILSDDELLSRLAGAFITYHSLALIWPPPPPQPWTSWGPSAPPGSVFPQPHTQIVDPAHPHDHPGGPLLPVPQQREQKRAEEMADGPEKQKALRAARKIPLLCEQPVEALEEALENVVHAVSEEGRGAPLLMWQGCPGACRPHPKGHLATYAVAPLAVPEDIFVSREARQAPCREADKRGNAMGGQEAMGGQQEEGEQRGEEQEEEQVEGETEQSDGQQGEGEQRGGEAGDREQEEGELGSNEQPGRHHHHLCLPLIGVVPYKISPMMWYDEIEPGTEPERSMSWEGTAPVFLETQAVDMLKVLNVEHPDYNHCKPYLQSSRESN